ncbi:hypothetical protein GCM10023340_42180 [Nocardioides marinquilinus]|uniref:Urease accessory protein n=1 Tax=Nocardioides marinquilinus TaxID=1210400 RepID=A0ABP9Q2B1_9ACTN
MSTLTRIEVSPGGVRLGHGVLAARRMRGPGPVVRVGLVGTEALLLAGDHVRLEVVVRGCAVEVVEIGGTVAYDMRDGATTSARWDVDVRLADGARLDWRAEPFVVATGADVRRTTTVELDGDSAATLRERVVLGRTGETGGRLTTSTHVTRDGVPLLVETLDLVRETAPGWAVLGAARCLDTVTALGHRLPDGPDVLQLAGQGSVRRWLGVDLHASVLDREPVTAGA